MNLAIVGSRNFTNYDLFLKMIDIKLAEIGLDICDIQMVVSGGAAGTDTLAERFAADYNIECRVFEANWAKYGTYAGPRRNSEIVDTCTVMIAFVAEDSIGTYDSINKARAKKIPVYEVDI